LLCGRFVVVGCVVVVVLLLLLLATLFSTSWSFLANKDPAFTSLKSTTLGDVVMELISCSMSLKKSGGILLSDFDRPEWCRPVLNPWELLPHERTSRRRGPIRVDFIMITQRGTIR